MKIYTLICADCGKCLGLLQTKEEQKICTQDGKLYQMCPFATLQHENCEELYVETYSTEMQQ